MGRAEGFTGAGFRTIFAAVARVAEEHPDKLALRMRRGDDEIRVSYRELIEASSRDAARLAALGLHRGDRIALFSENRPEWIRAYLSIVGADCTAVPIDRQLKQPDVEQLLDIAETRALIASPAAMATLSPELRRSLGERGVVLCDLERDLELYPESAAAATCPPTVDGDPSIATLIFTS